MITLCERHQIERFARRSLMERVDVDALRSESMYHHPSQQAANIRCESCNKDVDVLFPAPSPFGGIVFLCDECHHG